MVRLNKLFICIFLTVSLYGQCQIIVFYNVENLFDFSDDSLKNDNEFLPQSEKHWNEYRYRTKLQHTYQALVATSGWDMPAIIGLCEIENRYCLEGLAMHTQLSKAEYGIVHYESPDKRGIDVALLYRTKLFKVLYSAPLRPKFEKTDLATRDILYVKGVLRKDTLHVFVNHWPSRRGGQAQSEWKRVTVAKFLKHSTDSILSQDADANIVIMGDFNDEPTNKSIRHLTDPALGGNLVSLLPPKGGFDGSLKYKGQWFLYDQFIVSAPVLNLLKAGQMSVSDSPFLLSDDEKNLGSKPFRTYAGPRYLGGYSDHLPVFIQLNTQAE